MIVSGVPNLKIVSIFCCTSKYLHAWFLREMVNKYKTKMWKQHTNLYCNALTHDKVSWLCKQDP